MNECNFQHGMDFDNLIFESSKIYCECITSDVMWGNRGCSGSHLECILQQEEQTIKSLKEEISCLNNSIILLQGSISNHLVQLTLSFQKSLSILQNMF